MIRTTNRSSQALGLALLAGVALLAGCAGPRPVTRTTTTEQTTTTTPPRPAVSTTTTTTHLTQHP